VVSEYKRLFAKNTPILTPRLEGVVAELTRQADWKAALSSGHVSASVQDGIVTVNTTANVSVPVTISAGTTFAGTTTTFGTSYAGALSAWQSLTPEAPLRLQLN
jgi:hypothetical protein